MTEFVDTDYIRMFLCGQCSYVVGVAYKQHTEKSWFSEFCPQCGKFQVAEHAEPA